MNVFARLNDVAGDDAAIKLIFDHMRNIGICAVMLGASGFAITAPERFGTYPIYTILTGVMLGLAAVVLTILNAMHGLKKAKARSSPAEAVALIVFINAIGPLLLGALMIAGPFRG